jgi:hypothetical protein
MAFSIIRLRSRAYNDTQVDHQERAMSQPVSVNIPHALGSAEARRRLEQGFDNVERQMTGGLGLISFEKRWEGNRMHLQGRLMGQTITGRLEVLEQAVEMQIDLPDLLAAIANRIAGNLKTETQKLLGKK